MATQRPERFRNSGPENGKPTGSRATWNAVRRWLAPCVTVFFSQQLPTPCQYQALIKQQTKLITTTTITSEQTHSWHHMIIFPHFVDCISSWCSSEIVTFSVVGWSPSRCSRFSMRRRSSSTETPSNGTAGSRWMWKTQALWMHSLKAQKVWSEIRRHPGQVWWIMTTWWYS